MRKNEDLIENFYVAFTKKDYSAMQKCYHEDAHFRDPVFPNLDVKQVKAMWHMLCEAGKDLKIEYSGIGAHGNSAKAHWKAVYTFGKTGRIVHNSIDSNFILKDGLILDQSDSFNFWKWSRMALGTAGIILGWSGLLKDKIRSTAAGQLKRFIQNHSEYQ